MMERLAGAAGLPPPACCCHMFHATGITAYLASGGIMEDARAIAAHELPSTTKLWDRTNPPDEESIRVGRCRASLARQLRPSV
jgi:hypothetical protein